MVSRNIWPWLARGLFAVRDAAVAEQQLGLETNNFGRCPGGVALGGAGPKKKGLESDHLPRIANVGKEEFFSP
jgi:hypothetical protein